MNKQDTNNEMGKGIDLLYRCIQHSTFNIQHCAPRVIQHRLRRQFNTQHCRRLQFTIYQLTIAGIAENNSTFNTQHSTFKLVINVQRYSSTFNIEHSALFTILISFSIDD